ncbi:MAG TPA: ATP synthase F0 subunit B [Bryobacteraceae bacterium]|nr:ATP synthase F0 subunit B [Bryobacteraceae bacterium]
MKKLPGVLLVRVLLMGVLLIALPALAEESKSGESGGISPIWTWINFLILVGVLGYLIAKNMGPMLAARSHKIQEGLAAGERAKADATARAAAVEAQLKNLGSEIEKLRASAAADREREADRIARDTENELARIEQHAGQEIESAGKAARLDVRRYAAKLAIELAEQKLRARMSPDVQADLVRNFIGDIANGRAKAQNT